MKLLIVALDYPPASGGIATYASSLAEALAEQHEVTVLAAGGKDAHLRDARQPFLTLRSPDIPLCRVFGICLIFSWLLWRRKFDAVLHTVWPTSLLSYFWRKCFPVPYFVSVHASEILDDRLTFRRRLKWWLKGWKNRALAHAHGLFPVSHYTAGILKRMGFDKHRICVVSNGVDVNRFAPDKGTSAGKVPTLLTVARLDLHKGHDQVIRALGMLRGKGYDFNYLIAGNGDEETNLRMLADRLGLSGKVVFLGFVPDEQLPQTYACSDIYVMASREIPGRLDLIEGFGTSFLEASASGLPVVAGRSGGVSDAVVDGKTGILVDPDNVDDIAGALERLMMDRAFARLLGEQGRQWVVSERTWRKVAERMQQNIERLILA